MIERLGQENITNFLDDVAKKKEKVLVQLQAAVPVYWRLIHGNLSPSRIVLETIPLLDLIEKQTISVERFTELLAETST